MDKSADLTPKIFISYAWKNQTIAKRLQSDLQRDGVEVFVDYEKISGGDSLPERISAALEWCNTLVLLWSTDSAQSYYVSQEWTSAFHLQKRIIACVLDGAPLPALLAGRLYLNFAAYETGYAQLCRSLGVQPKVSAEKTAPPETPPSRAKRPAVLHTITSKLKHRKPPSDEVILVPSGEPRVESPAQAWWRRGMVTNITFILIVAAVIYFSYLLLSSSGPVHLRSEGKKFPIDSVKVMLKEFDFYCAEYEWNKEWSNPQGKGIDNQFEPSQNNKVIFDRKTGLTWQQSGSEKEMPYVAAKAYVDSLARVNYASYSNWRLPTLEEAMSLMESKKHGDLYIDSKFDSRQWWIWTADTCSAGRAWFVYFNQGFFNCNDVVGINFYVRAVR